tara:strand:- start:26496 stop:26765 length:270 start_codon:yes stop_codon:yes gene_type:complete
MINCEQQPRRKPINNSFLVCALRYNLEVATIPVNRVNKLMAMVMFVSKWMLSAIIKVRILPIPNRCMLVLNLKKSRIRVAHVAVRSPVK